MHERTFKYVDINDKRKIVQRLWDNSIQKGWCLLYKSSEPDGYSRIMLSGERYLIHRISAYIFHDFNLNLNLPICHAISCKNRNCWAPWHIYVGTNSDNMLDAALTSTHHETQKTHCPKGHEYTLLNTVINRGKRQCRECHRTRWRKK